MNYVEEVGLFAEKRGKSVRKKEISLFITKNIRAS